MRARHTPARQRDLASLEVPAPRVHLALLAPGHRPTTGAATCVLLILLAATGLLVVACGGDKRPPAGTAAAATATVGVAPQSSLPAGDLLYVGWIRDWMGIRHLVLHHANADGSEAIDIDGQLDGTDGSLSVIPGTQQVVYAVCAGTCHPRIYDAATGARHDVKTTSSARSVAVSPDGRRLAYASETGLYSSGIDGSGERRIVSFPATATVYAVAWSPDGTRIAFIGGVRGLDPVIGSEARDVYVMDASGSSVPVQLGIVPNCDPLRDPSRAACSTPTLIRLRPDHLVWAADGKALLVSGGTVDEGGLAGGFAMTLGLDGKATAPELKLGGICRLARVPGICGLTYVFARDNLALLRFGGPDLQLVDLSTGKARFVFKLGNDGSLTGVRNAVWLPASTSPRAPGDGSP